MLTHKISSWIVFFLCVCVASSSGFVFPLGADNEWFSTLNTPAFAPPNWLFGPVWTILYIMISASAYYLVQDYIKNKNEYFPIAIALWCLQLALNVIWTPIFSGAQNLKTAFYYIIALWISITLYIIISYKVSKKSSILMMPYIAWVSFASILNYTYWQINL